MATNYTRAWSNTTPANTDARKDGARDMRYIRVDVDERLPLTSPGMCLPSASASSLSCSLLL